MTYAIIINSLTGNTKLLADTIYNTLGTESCIYFGPNNEKAKQADIIYVGFWTNQSTCDDVSKQFLSSLTNENIFLFGTAGFASEEYIKEIIKNVKFNLKDTVTVKGSFMCQGKMQQRVKDRYLKMKQENSNPNVDFMIANFDKALSHPDATDLENLKKELIK